MIYPRGVIYQSGKSKSSGEIKLVSSGAKKVFYRFFRGIGAGLISFAIVGVIFAFWPIVKEEYLYRFGTKNEEVISGFGELLSKSDAAELGLDPYFSVYIPKINAKAKIIPNVDAGSPVDYLKALSKGVAHAKGTNYPGQGKLIYLFSHSTDSPLNFARYNAVFYLLGKLEKGDRIIVYFMGQQYQYTVAEELTTSATDTSWLTDNGQGEELVLQTCDPPGTSFGRLIIIARPI